MSNNHDEIIIGEQIWMSYNLDSTKFQNGELIPECKSKQEWEDAGMDCRPACCYYDNIAENSQKLGVLYNWFAINDKRGISLEGWRIPTCEDWDQLIQYAGGNKVASKKLKSLDLWASKGNGASGNGTNEFSFNAFPAGQRNFLGQFNRINLSACWWSLNSDDDNRNWFYYLNHDSDSIGKGLADLEDGFSVRLIKNQ